MKRAFTTIVLGMATLLVLPSCKREERGFKVQPPSAAAIQSTRLVELIPGATNPANSNLVEVTSFTAHTRNDYEENAYALAEGKRLYSWFNCVGCHARGGGGMGPAIMDDKWIYGSAPEQIFATIVQGRPNGMPSFGGRIPEYQVWQIAAYVRSLSGLAAKDAAPGRNDDINAGRPEHSREAQKPKPVEGNPK